MPKLSPKEWDRNDQTVASNLRRARLARNMSQTTLAEALGVTFQQVQKYEKGVNAIPTGRLRQICHTLKTSPNELYAFNGSGEELPTMSTWEIKMAMKLNKIENQSVRNAIANLIAAEGE